MRAAVLVAAAHPDAEIDARPERVVKLVLHRHQIAGDQREQIAWVSDADRSR